MIEKNRKNETVIGVKWAMLGQLIKQASNFLIGILMTRLLTPNDFGLIAMITVFTGFLSVYKDFGLGSYLIYKKEVTTEDYNTVFYTHILLGFLLALVLFISGGLIADFYREDSLKPLIMVISVSFIIQSFSYIQYTIYKKNMDFKTIFIVDSISIIISGTLAIFLAYFGFGVWSLVVKLLLLSAMTSILLWYFSKWKPSLVFDKMSLKESFNYSLPLLGNKTASYFMRNSDNLLIGKFIGSSALGIYSRAYSLMMLPVNQVSGVLLNVFFPSFSKINNDLHLIKSNWLKINSFLAFFLFPLSVGIIIFSEAFTMIILGPQWQEAIPIIQILAFSGAIQAITNIGYILNALGKTRINFKMNLWINLILLSAIGIGIFWGILGVAICYTFASVLFVPAIRWHYIINEINVSLTSIIKSLKVYFFVSIIIGAIFYFLIYYFQLNYKVQLYLITFGFMLVYLFVLRILKNNILQEVVRYLKK